MRQLLGEELGSFDDVMAKSMEIVKKREVKAVIKNVTKHILAQRP